MVQLGPLSRAMVKRVSVPVSQLELDMFVIGLYGPRADPEFLRDPAGSEAGTSQRKDMQFTVSQFTPVRMCCGVLDDLVNSAQCDLRTNIKLTCKDSTYSMDQLFPRPGFHPVACSARVQRTFCINIFRLSRYSKNPRPAKTCSELFDDENPVVVVKKWFNDEQIWLVLFHQLARGPLITREPTQCIA